MTRRAGRWVLLAAAVLTAGIAGAENKFDYCLLCHGDNANGNYGIRAPKLSGMEPWYLARQLENFAAGIRGTPAEDASGHEMMPVGLRVKQEAVLAAAVAWIGTLQSKKPILTVSGDVAHGRQLYQTCVACHGARGQETQNCRLRLWHRVPTGTRSRSCAISRPACAAWTNATRWAPRCARSAPACPMTRPSPTWWRSSTLSESTFSRTSA